MIKKTFSIILDNAFTKIKFALKLVNNLNLCGSLICNGEFYHICYCAHIINLIVHDGSKDIDDVVGKICDCIKYVKVS